MGSGPLAHGAETGSALGPTMGAALLVLAAFVGAAVVLGGRRGRSGRRRWRAAAWVSALLTLAIAVAPPLEAAAEGSLVAHMVQHLLLLVVVAPLLVGAGALPLLLGRLGVGAWPAGASMLWRVLARALHRPGAVIVLALVHSVVILLWHVPALYHAALRHPVVHALEHASFLLVAVLFWWSLAVASRRRDGSLLVAALVSTALAFGAGLLLAVLMTFAPAPWYSHHHPAELPGLGELGPLVDQQLAGAVMWSLGGPAYVVGAAWLLAAVLRRASVTAAGPVLPVGLPGEQQGSRSGASDQSRE